MLHDFLLEIGCEELPSLAVQALSKALTEGFSRAFNEAGIAFATIESFGTPRRLAVRVNELATETIPLRQFHRGPTKQVAFDDAGEPTKALLGFLRSLAITVDQLTTLETEKGVWLGYDSLTPGKPVQDCLPHLITQVVSALPIKKPMRWGESDITFARPVHWIVALLDDTILPCEVLGVKADRFTKGHRFHALGPHRLGAPKAYEDCLEEVKVIANFATRREMIINQVNSLAASLDAKPVLSEDLLNEITSIVEWPNALIASFSARFLAVPKEALIAAMQGHQKCVPLEDKNKQLLPHFIAVSNLTSQNPGRVVQGNERVMSARLSDAAFFFDTDRQKTLADRIPLTKTVVYQAKLGSVFDKTTRMTTLIEVIANQCRLPIADATRAATLSKCDLMTGMVGEFPELEGIMGDYYARHDGESAVVATALREQYQPKSAMDLLPASAIGWALSLVDRLDTLVGLFLIGQKPTGDKDPFKLRRHALAVARLLMAAPTQLSLSFCLDAASVTYTNMPSSKEQLTALATFIVERLQAYYQAEGISGECLQAVLASERDDLSIVDSRVKALASFIKTPAFIPVMDAAKRVHSVLANAKDALTECDAALFTVAEETHLLAAVVAFENAFPPNEKANDSALLEELTPLTTHLTAFFDAVMVMTDDAATRINRLALLRRIASLFLRIADFSKLQRV